MSLLRCGEAQKQLGEAEKKFVQSADIHFLTPLRSFSDGQYKALQVTHVRHHHRHAAKPPPVASWIFTGGDFPRCVLFICRTSARCCWTSVWTWTSLIPDWEKLMRRTKRPEWVSAHLNVEIHSNVPNRATRDQYFWHPTPMDCEHFLQCCCVQYICVIFNHLAFFSPGQNLNANPLQDDYLSHMSYMFSFLRVKWLKVSDSWQPNETFLQTLDSM